MDYSQPFGTSAGTAYTNGNPSTGTQGSIPPAGAIEYDQREIVNVISAAGITPSNADLTQLLQAIRKLANINPTGSTQKAPKLVSVTVTATAVNCASATNTILSPMTISQNNLGTSTYASGVFTCGTGEAGLYLVQAYIWFPAPVGGVNASVSVKKNGVQWQTNGQMSAGNSGDGQVANLTYLIPLAVGDTLSFYGFQQTGSTYSTTGCGASVTLISAY